MKKIIENKKFAQINDEHVRLSASNEFPVLVLKLSINCTPYIYSGMDYRIKNSTNTKHILQSYR